MNNLLIIVIGIFALFLSLQFIMRIRSWSKRGKKAPEVGGRLGRTMGEGGKMVAYFYSPTCRACRVMETHLSKIQEKFDRIIRINIATDRETAAAFGIMGTPTTVIIENGIITDYLVGITPASRLIKSLTP